MLSQQVHADQVDAVPPTETSVLPDQPDHPHFYHHADRYRRLLHHLIGERNARGEGFTRHHYGKHTHTHIRDIQR